MFITSSSDLLSRYCGLYATFILPSTFPLSGGITFASIFTNVVFPIPFSPSIPMIWFLPTCPFCAFKLNVPSFLVMSVHSASVSLLIDFSGGRERKCIEWSLNLMFSSLMNPSR